MKKSVTLQILEINVGDRDFSNLAMANHKSQFKRIRQNKKRRLENRYWAKTMRNAVKKLRNATTDSDIKVKIPKVVSLIDKVAKKKIIHKNKAANLKSGLMRLANKVVA
jgi:small subunit ribosomal protein S20